MPRILRVFGLRRSGNHAIIEWIAAHYRSVLHWNDCIGWRNPQPNNVGHYGHKSGPYDLIIYSYEDFEPSVEELTSESTLMILRDWPSMAASRSYSGRSGCRVRHHRRHDRPTAEAWAAFATQCLRFPAHTIQFNFWNSDESYRRSLEERFALPGHIPYVTTLPASGMGRGSSFGDKVIDLRQVNDRLSTVAALRPEIARNILAATECMTLSQLMFGGRYKQQL